MARAVGVNFGFRESVTPAKVPQAWTGPCGRLAVRSMSVSFVLRLAAGACSARRVGRRLDWVETGVISLADDFGAPRYVLVALGIGARA